MGVGARKCVPIREVSSLLMGVHCVQASMELGRCVPIREVSLFQRVYRLE